MLQVTHKMVFISSRHNTTNCELIKIKTPLSSSPTNLTYFCMYMYMYTLSFFLLRSVNHVLFVRYFTFTYFRPVAKKYHHRQGWCFSQRISPILNFLVVFILLETPLPHCAFFNFFAKESFPNTWSISFMVLCMYLSFEHGLITIYVKYVFIKLISGIIIFFLHSQGYNTQR